MSTNAPVELRPSERRAIVSWIARAALGAVGYADFAARTCFRLVPGIW